VSFEALGIILACGQAILATMVLASVPSLIKARAAGATIFVLALSVSTMIYLLKAAG
jgi:hypothetical protein